MNVTYPMVSCQRSSHDVELLSASPETPLLTCYLLLIVRLRPHTFTIVCILPATPSVMAAGSYYVDTLQTPSMSALTLQLSNTSISSMSVLI